MAKLQTFARVRALTGWHAKSFCIALLLRMVPNYRMFAEMTEQEDSQALDKVLRLIQESLAAPSAKVNFSVQREKIESLAPDIAAYDLFGVFPANDACMAMIATLNLLLGDDLQGAVVVSKLSQGSVEAYLLASDIVDDSDLNHHPLMEYEVSTQNELLDILESCSSNRQSLDRVIKFATQDNMTNLGISLD